MTSVEDRELLLDELELFMKGRIILRLLPIQDRLRMEGSGQLANVLATAMNDVRFNLREILISHSHGVRND